MLRRMLLILVGLTLSACGQATSIPTALPSQTPTLTVAPSGTPSPTSTPTTTPTPFPTLGSKPYLMVSQDRESQSFSIYDSNGGRKTIELPPDGHIKGVSTNLNTIVSPDGKWLVFFTDFPEFLDGSLDAPVKLKLLNITDGTVKTVANVVTDGYTEKLDQLAEQLKKLDPKHYKNIDDSSQPDGIEWVGSGLITAFKWGIYSIAWSPDSRILAFAAQIDGLSSDVYLYDLETGIIQRAEDSLQNVTGIRWSLDGKKIIFTNAEPGSTYMGAPELYIITPSKKAVENPKLISSESWLGSFDAFTKNWSPTGDWLSPNILLITRQTPDAGSYSIDALNINTGQLTPLWRDSFDSYAVDSKNKAIVVSTANYGQPENLGLHLIALNGRKVNIFKGDYYLELFFRGGAKHLFLAQGISPPTPSAKYQMLGDVVGLDLSGKPTMLGCFDYKQISISPDYTWLLMFDDTKLYLYDTHDELVKTFPIPAIQRIFWHPDSQGIVYSADAKLYTLDLPDGNPKWIGDGNIYDAVWLP